MRIGIITQPLSRNYGGILQNYALQRTLTKLGHTAYTFDILPRTSRWGIIAIKNIAKMLLGKSYAPIKYPSEIKQQENHLRQFVEKHITLISPRCTLPTVDKAEEYRLDALIVGSDQVWRPKYNRSIADMFLGFARNMNIKRVAYAASFGTDEWEYSSSQTDECSALAQKFNAISVREDSGVRLCNDYLGVDAQHVLDPTMLLSAEEYNSTIKDIPVETTPYLFAYILNANPQKIDYINKVATQKGLKVIIKGADGGITREDSIERWLAYFRDAKYIITDSFHGCVFSIIYHVPFVAMANKARGLSRFLSLLSIFKLEDRLIIPNPDIAQISDPNWIEVDALMQQWQKMSIKFLQESLN